MRRRVDAAVGGVPGAALLLLLLLQCAAPPALVHAKIITMGIPDDFTPNQDLSGFYSYLSYWRPYTESQLRLLAKKFPSGLKILFWGDSLVRQQKDWLCEALDLDSDGAGMEGRISWRPNERRRCSSAELNIEVMFMVERAREFAPDVVYFNAALHVLHLYPARPFEENCLASALRYERSVARFMETLHTLRPSAAAAAPAPAPAVFFLTTHAGCDDLLYGKFQEARRLWGDDPARPDPGALRQCVAELRARLPSEPGVHPADIPGDDESLERLCRDTTFLDASMAGLNRRAVATLRRYAAVRGYPAPVRVVPGYEITRGQCGWATHDTIHFPPLVPMEMARVLSSLLDDGLGAPLQGGGSVQRQGGGQEQAQGQGQGRGQGQGGLQHRRRRRRQRRSGQEQDASQGEGEGAEEQQGGGDPQARRGMRESAQQEQQQQQQAAQVTPLPDVVDVEDVHVGRSDAGFAEVESWLTPSDTST